MTDKTTFSVGVVVTVLISAAWAYGAASPAVTCQVRKLKTAGKYVRCRLRADAKAVRKGEAPDYANCQTRLSKVWAKTESRAGVGVCPTEGDQAGIDARISENAGDIVTLVTGGTPTCGNLAVDSGEQCDGADLNGADCTMLGFAGGALGCRLSCYYDTSGCTGGAGFALFVGIDPMVGKTGQTAFWGPGSDGDIEPGRSLDYVDNGDGTITDLSTGLMWEKKDDSDGIHGQKFSYQWQASGYGPGLSEFLDVLNDVAGGGASCFAGYCDWRIPSVKELQSLVDYGRDGDRSIDPIFHQPETCTGCTDVTQADCSCTPYFRTTWSSTSSAVDPTGQAEVVFFRHGHVWDSSKTGLLNSHYVRAVRGGL
jgi:hypothetical protein